MGIPAYRPTTSHFWSVAQTFDWGDDLEDGDAADARWAGFFGGIFRREDAPMMAGIESNMDGADLWDLHPVVLPRGRGAVLVRRLLVQRMAADRGDVAQALAAE